MLRHVVLPSWLDVLRVELRLRLGRNVPGRNVLSGEPDLRLDLLSAEQGVSERLHRRVRVPGGRTAVRGLLLQGR
jgi:hypothetical protein